MSIGGNISVAQRVPGTVAQSAAALTVRPSPTRPVPRVSTLPSYEAYVVDVPEVTNLSAEFEYHYFVPDEGASETGEVPDRFLTRSGETFDSATLDLMRTRVPRLVSLSFTPPLPASTTSGPVTEAQQKEAAAAVAAAAAAAAKRAAMMKKMPAKAAGN